MADLYPKAGSIKGKGKAGPSRPQTGGSRAKVRASTGLGGGTSPPVKGGGFKSAGKNRPC